MIPLDDLLRAATDGNYRNLVTRPTGAAVRDRLLDTLRASPRTEVRLDFTRIGLVDYSCADEVVAKLVTAVRDLPVARVILHGVREDHADAIGHALERHRLMILALMAPTLEPVLLGAVDRDWRMTFEVLLGRGPVGVGPLAAQLGWTPDRVAASLAALVEGRCVVGYPDGTHEVGPLT